MTIKLNLEPQKHCKSGWILVLGDKFWGETYPEDRGHGGGPATYGWSDDLRKVRIADQDEKPPHKGWFTHQGNTYEIERMSKGEWVKIELTTCYSLCHFINF